MHKKKKKKNYGREGGRGDAGVVTFWGPWLLEGSGGTDKVNCIFFTFGSLVAYFENIFCPCVSLIVCVMLQCMLYAIIIVTPTFAQPHLQFLGTDGRRDSTTRSQVTVSKGQ